MRFAKFLCVCQEGSATQGGGSFGTVITPLWFSVTPIAEGDTEPLLSQGALDISCRLPRTNCILSLWIREEVPLPSLVLCRSVVPLVLTH